MRVPTLFAAASMWKLYNGNSMIKSTREKRARRENIILAIKMAFFEEWSTHKTTTSSMYHWFFFLSFLFPFFCSSVRCVLLLWRACFSYFFRFIFISSRLLCTIFPHFPHVSSRSSVREYMRFHVERKVWKTYFALFSCASSSLQDRKTESCYGFVRFSGRRKIENRKSFRFFFSCVWVKLESANKILFSHVSVWIREICKFST